MNFDRFSAHNDSVVMGRRGFLKVSGGLAAGLTLGFCLGETEAEAATLNPSAPFAPNAFVRIDSKGVVTVISKHLEMGQGTYTGLATLVAEELDAKWEHVRVEGAPADAKRYSNLFWGPTQGTGGSSSIANSWEQLRRAGATARAMFVAAAAQKWQVPAAEIAVSNGEISHRSGKKASFADLVELAAQQAVPSEIKLKNPSDFKLIGKKASRRDSVDKTTGKAIFTQDIQLPGMLTALVAHPPRFGATVASFDASASKAIKGVVDVIQIPSGVAVLARGFWAAKKGRDVLRVTWDDSKAVRANSADLLREYKALSKTAGKTVTRRGDAATVFKDAASVVTAEISFPFLAHASMEPLNCVVHFQGDKAEMWNGQQSHTQDQAACAAVLGLKPEQVSVHALYAGGSFGRRASLTSDYVVEAAHIAKAVGSKAPVKLVWTREDDMRGGYYRPLYVHQVSAGLDDKGKLMAWQHRIVGQSLLIGSAFESMLVKDGVDATSVEGVSDLPYAVPNLNVEVHNVVLGIPVLWWRSVGHTHTAYAKETVIDQVAVAAKQDPVAFRLGLLELHPRQAAALKLAADKAGWSKPLAASKAGEKRGRGVAVHESFRSIVAQVAEVTVRADGSFTVDRVVCVVDCGTPINPDNIVSQMEGSIGFALAALLHGEITLQDGLVQQSNFHDYRTLTLREMPKVEVHIVPSQLAPTGVGEPGVPPLAPAVANALAAATGKRAMQLPFKSI